LGGNYSRDEKSENTFNTTVLAVPLNDLTDVDHNERLQKEKVDACFIVMGVGHPYSYNLHYWHSVEVEMIASMARLCGDSMKSRHTLLLSAVDAELNPESFDAKSLDKEAPKLGWWGMLQHYSRMMGLKQRAVASVDSFQFIRIFQPSNIVTESTRYGWFDWILLRLLPYLDPIMPEQYHSVPVQMLGMAMTRDAEEVLQGDTHATLKERVTYLGYEDYIRLSGDQYQKLQNEKKTSGEEL